MHRSQQWLKFSITTLMFALASFAQKEHVLNRLGLSVEADQRKQATSFSVSTLLARNLHDVSGENDPARRRTAIDEIFTEDCVFYEPSGHAQGHSDRSVPPPAHINSVFHLSGEAGAAVLAYEQPLLWWVIGEDATVARRKTARLIFSPASETR